MIHPIAGKCKHCKADLSTYRTARPAANAPLPALQRPAGNAPSNGANGHANGHAVRPVALAAPAIAAAHDVPVLPPRPSRSQTVEPAASSWRSWPVLVIVLAMLAIIAAVVLMVWPDGDPGQPARALQPPPAPERMPTAPDLKQPPTPRAPAVAPQPAPSQPKASKPDPWDSSAPAPAPRDPSARAAPDPSDSNDTADSDDTDDSAIGALKNPFAPSPSRPLPLNRHGALLTAMLVHVCRKLADCNLDDPVTTNLCEQLSHDPPPPPSCPAAMRCLRHIDGLSCGGQPGTLMQLGTLMTRFQDCADAARC